MNESIYHNKLLKDFTVNYNEAHCAGHVCSRFKESGEKCARPADTDVEYTNEEGRRVGMWCCSDCFMEVFAPMIAKKESKRSA